MLKADQLEWLRDTLLQKVQLRDTTVAMTAALDGLLETIEAENEVSFISRILERIARIRATDDLMSNDFE